MSARAYSVIGLIAVVVIAGAVLAHIERQKKTAELLAQLDTGEADEAVDTMAALKTRGGIEDELIQRTRSDRRKERMRAASLLGEVGTAAKAGPALEALLNDEWPPVRRAAVVAVRQVGHMDAVSPLMSIVRDPEQEMDTRCLAVESIAVLRMKGLSDDDAAMAALPLVEILERRPEVPPEEDEEEADEEEVEEEEEVPEDQKPPEEEAAPADEEIELRKECVLALALIGTPEALEAVCASADDQIEPAALVRRYACVALEDLRAIPDAPGVAPSMAEALDGALDDADAEVRLYAVRALTRHARFVGDDVPLGIDEQINEKLARMSAELTAEGETSYWVRRAAMLACDSRHISPEEATPAHESSS
jgi:HEAT repeat protein